MVRVGSPPKMDPSRLRGQLKGLLQLYFQSVELGLRHFFVKCASTHEQELLIAQDGANLDGRIHVQYADFSMTGDQILNFVGKLLRGEEEFYSLQTCGHITPGQGEVSPHVQNDPPRVPSDPKKKQNVSPKNPPSPLHRSVKTLHARFGYCCWTCALAEKPSGHDWVTCEYNQQVRARKFGRGVRNSTGPFSPGNSTNEQPPSDSWVSGCGHPLSPSMEGSGLTC